ncbi:hypothetical protein DRF57_18090 [Chryseobacterium rhizosphaerae]|uniref:Uncharacterized protein n=1 Tax=Chryseobacterium rhizosphaerae TaxID=395937 RepID=A0ABX9IIE7_9FLAO|nr:hypothetical protein DRF57_18090 [Chryseobacterium rhizosphaerae]
MLRIKIKSLALQGFWLYNTIMIIFPILEYEQKLNYIHQNPVVSSFVIEPWECKYSSNRNYCDVDQKILEIAVNL